MTPTQLILPATSEATTPGGELSPEFLAALRDGYELSPADRALHNAVANNDLGSLALNRQVIRGDDGHFSHRIRSQGITDQQKSGRCWIFAGLNALRPQVIRDHRMEEFKFSGAYLQFWDKLEKANLFLEAVIELRDAHFLDREWEAVTKTAVEDGGWWNYLVDLVEKYGVVPLAAMPETHASTHTDTLNHVLGRLLRAHAVQILDRHADGAGLDDLRTVKQAALREVYRLLVLNLGQPPAEFEWRYRRAKNPDQPGAGPLADMRTAEEDQLSALERHTPQSFYRKYVGRSLAEFVCLYNDPQNELDRHYRFDRARNIVGSECMHFVNIGAAPMKEIAMASILANEPLWFAVNMAFDQSEAHGLMANQLFDFEALFGVGLTVSKADRTRFHAGASCHAMVLRGVDLDAAGQPRKWLAENSHGDAKGANGCWTLHDSWFDEHVYTVIVHRRHVPARILRIFEEESIVLPAWYPGAAGSRT